MRWLAVAILAAVALIYLPVVHGDFLWDDWPSMRDLVGDRWAHYVFRDFNHWTYYFRPLPVAFFTLQLKLFDSAPGPMHVVSLVLHLINTTLIGLLARRVSKLSGDAESRQQWATLICMALYGLHPALIEPVVWVGLQTDLIVTMLTLCGLLVTTSIENQARRAASLAALFFFAACTKEAASIFPILVVIFDWALFARTGGPGFMATVRRLFQRNWPAYAGMLVMGIAYLALRHWALGKPPYPITNGLPNALARFQEICFIYTSYLKIIIWPISGIGPLHPVDISPFLTLGGTALFTDVVAVGLVLAGLYLALRRGSAAGFIILAVTAALLPVIHILPVAFERSLYHERYAMIAIAMTCSLLPLLKWPRMFAEGGALSNVPRLLMPAAIFLWLAFSIIDIRIIVPKWNSDATLWEWAIAIDPHSTQAKDNLLLTYERTDPEKARKLGDALLAEPDACSSCMLHLSRIALDHDDTTRAAAALNKAKDTLLVTHDKESRQFYLRQLGRLLNMQGRHKDAEQVLEVALKLDPKDTVSQQELEKARSSGGSSQGQP